MKLYSLLHNKTNYVRTGYNVSNGAELVKLIKNILFCSRYGLRKTSWIQWFLFMKN